MYNIICTNLLANIKYHVNKYVTNFYSIGIYHAIHQQYASFIIIQFQQSVYYIFGYYNQLVALKLARIKEIRDDQ